MTVALLISDEYVQTVPSTESKLVRVLKTHLLHVEKAKMRKDFCYVYSADLKIPIRVRIVSLFGHASARQLSDSAAVTLQVGLRLYQPCTGLLSQVYCNEGRRVCGCEIMTSYRSYVSPPGPNRDIQKWDEVLIYTAFQHTGWSTMISPLWEFSG